MDFGKLEDISKVDFSLPPDANGNKGLFEKLKNQPRQKLKVYVGCPVWSNKNWVGSWYPAYAKEKDFLHYYTRQFNTIELNTSHYHIPDAETIRKWVEMASQGFKFAPKFPQEISHQLLPEGIAEEQTFAFCDAIMDLKEFLGMSFLQLPPYFTPQQLEKLEEFLSFLPAEIPVAFEFRHTDWFKKKLEQPDFELEKAATMLQHKNHAMVITDVAGRRDVLHMRLTSPELILRFVGNNLHPTDFSRVDEWVTRLKEWTAKGLHTIYFFAHEPDSNASPELAQYFIRQMNREFRLQIAEPQAYSLAKQGNLFE